MILYSTDPAPSGTMNATVYAGPFTVPTSATIAAVAVQSGLATSAVASPVF